MTLKKTACRLLLVLVFLPVFNLSAQEKQDSGFSGFIFLGAAYSTSDLSLDDASEDENRLIQSLSQDSKEDSGMIPVILSSLSYQFAETGTSVSIGSEDGGFMISVSQILPEWGTLSAGSLYGKEDVFADPFITGKARAVTDKETLGFFISWEDILDMPIYAGYRLQFKDIENDLAGQKDQRLKRDGHVHGFDIGSAIFGNDRHEIVAGVTVEAADLSGRSLSYNGLGLELSHTLTGNGWDLESTLSMSMRDYDGEHPKFGKTLDEEEFGIGSTYTWYDPFGFQDYFISVFGSYTRIQANINFYDASDLTIGMGIGYRF